MTDPIQVAPPAGDAPQFLLVAGDAIIQRHTRSIDALETDARSLPTGAVLQRGGRVLATLMREPGGAGHAKAWLLGGAR